ncbi:MAG: class I SAM-dependent methyltransferase [Candidatus Aenigmarchaeota archaeon]
MDLRMGVIRKFAKGKILDVGFRDGTLHSDIVKRYSEKNVWGLDITLKKETNRLLRGSAEKMDKIKNADFDTIVAGELIEHLKAPEKFVKECKRVLKKDGTVIVTTPNVKSLINRIFKNNRHSGHISLFHKSSLTALFERNGFRIAEFSYLPYTEHSSPGKSDELGFFKNLIKNRGRRFLHHLLPSGLREDMVLVAARS